MIIKILTYIIISFLLFLIISKISYNYNLLDKPNKRSVHIRPTAYTGGVALSLIFIFSIKIFNTIPTLDLILSMGFLIALVGFIDDKFTLNAGGKLSLQIFPIAYLVIIENLALNNIGDYNFFKLNLSSFSIPFTLISILLLVNSFNYFDGHDGTLTISTSSVLIILFFLISDENIRLFLITIFIPLLIFLLFNFSTFNLTKLFLGDSGSLLLGFVISFTLIFGALEKLVHPILLAFSISIFVYEFLSINIIRLINKKNIFLADKNHLHHVIFNYNKSLFKTNFFIFFLNIFLFTIGYISFLLIGSLASMVIFIIFFTIYFILRKKYFYHFN